MRKDELHAGGRKCTFMYFLKPSFMGEPPLMILSFFFPEKLLHFHAKLGCSPGNNADIFWFLPLQQIRAWLATRPLWLWLNGACISSGRPWGQAQLKIPAHISWRQLISSQPTSANGLTDFPLCVQLVNLGQGGLLKLLQPAYPFLCKNYCTPPLPLLALSDWINATAAVIDACCVLYHICAYLPA